MTQQNQIIRGDNLQVMKELTWKFNLIYIDPPFNTGEVQRGSSEELYYSDSFSDFQGFIGPRLVEARRLLTPDGSIFVHIDYREVHYVKIMMDQIFGRDCFMNEIIWAYDYGGRPKNRWPAKHDNILWYVRDPKNYVFNYDSMDRIPYMAPGLVGAEKAERGKTPTDVWWQTVVPTMSKERTGYPTQKPLPILERIIKIHSNEGAEILDFFAGSGTTGHATHNVGDRYFTLVDSNPKAIEVMRERLAHCRILVDGEEVRMTALF